MNWGFYIVLIKIIKKKLIKPSNNIILRNKIPLYQWKNRKIQIQKKKKIFKYCSSVRTEFIRDNSLLYDKKKYRGIYIYPSVHLTVCSILGKRNNNDRLLRQRVIIALLILLLLLLETLEEMGRCVLLFGSGLVGW